MQTTAASGSTPIRRLKITDKAFPRRRNRYAFFPCICLSGKWLQDQGFASGAQIEIACEAGRLVITVAGTAGTHEAAGGLKDR